MSKKLKDKENSFTPVDDVPETTTPRTDLSLPEVKPLTDEAHVQNPTGPAQPVRQKRTEGALPKVESLTDNAKVQNPTDKPATPKVASASPWESMLAGMRKTAEKEKTDAAKMQQYHALTDVFNALGKMGGAAIGGAIGGNALDSAPATGEYKESRAYLDAFERAKKANERLRSIDDKGFQLAYEKQQRDEERAYNENIRRIERETRQKEAQAERDWKAKFFDYQTKIQQAIADKDWGRKAKLEMEMAAAKYNHEIHVERIKNEGDLEVKKLSKEIVELQNDNRRPIAFDDGTTMMIGNDYYKELVTRLMNKVVNGSTVTKENVDAIIRANPTIVRDFMKMFGHGGASVQTPVQNQTQTQTTQQSSGPSHGVGYDKWLEAEPTNYVEQTPSTEQDLTKKWAKSKVQK